MSRPKKEVSTTAFDAVEESVTENTTETSTVMTSEANTSEVKAGEEMENTETSEANTSEVKENSQSVSENQFYDDEMVKIKSEKRAGKKITANTKRTIEFDSEGNAEVTGLEAKYLLTCPGFELVK